MPSGLKGAHNGYADLTKKPEPKKIPTPGPEPSPDTPPQPAPKTPPNPAPEKQPGTDTDTGTGMGTQTGTDAVLQQMLKPSDNYVRKVYYPLDYQEQFIKKNAKKYKRTESEILRIALDYFIKNGKI